MEIYYQGTDITGFVHVHSCKVRDTAGNRCDSLDIEFENAAGWYRWQPEEDDQIIVAHGRYNSGVMYLNTIMPEDGRYRILATSLPCKARNKENAAYYQKTIEDIMRSCAAMSGMDFQIFGLDPYTVIPYIERDHEGGAAFLHKLLTLEGAMLKCVNGKYTAIGISYAQDLPALQTVNLTAKQQGIRYSRSGMTLKGVTLKTPYASATAKDTAVADSHMHLITGDVPVLEDIQAGRWARGKLLHMNRQTEKVDLQGDFNAGLTAMVRIDIDGDTDATGEWLAEEVEHDLIEKRTTAVLRRCIRTIQ